MKLFGNMKTEENTLVIGGVKTTKLVEEFGTPLYVMDEQLLRDNCKKYITSFKCKERGNKVAYAPPTVVHNKFENLFQ